MLDHFQRVLDAFRAKPVLGKPDQWQGYCTLHRGGTEKHPSVSIRLRDGKLIVCCFVCGRELKESILKAAGLEYSMLFADHNRDSVHVHAQEPSRSRVVAWFDYQDEAGRPLYRVFRYQPKGFVQGRYDPSWEQQSRKPRQPEDPWFNYAPGLGDVRRVLYRLPELVAAPDRSVHIPEGEGVVELLRDMGAVATCNPGGCGMGWSDSYSETLRGRDVCVYPDHDPPGYRHADQVVGSLMRHSVASVRVVLLPGLPPGGDLKDWIAQGGTRAQLHALVTSTPAWKPS